MTVSVPDTNYQETPIAETFVSRKRPFVIRCCCNVRTLSCLLLFIGIFFSSFFAWSLAFVAGLISTLDSVRNVREVQVNFMQLSLERLLLLPHHVALQTHKAGIAANATLNVNADPIDEKLRIQRTMSPISRKYNGLLPGMSLYLGTADGNLYMNSLTGAEEQESGVSRPEGISPGVHSWISGKCDAYRVNCTLDIDTVRIRDYHRMDFDVVSSFTVPTTYYPAGRPWYNSTMLRKQPLITDPYVFVGARTDIGLTYTYPVYGPNGDLYGIWAVDYYLDLFSDFLDTLSVGRKQNGHLFVADREGKVIASSRSNETYLNEEEIFTQYLAIELHDGQQRKAAQMIDRRWGFDKVQHGASGTFNAMVFDVLILDIEYNGYHLLESDWIVVIITPYFDDYFVLFTWLNGVSVTAVAILISFSVVAAVFWFSCCLTIPLQNVGKKMELIQDMDLDNIEIGRKALLQEIYSIQQSFEFTISKLKEYKAFLPTYLLENETDVNPVQDNAKASATSDSKSVSSSRASSNESSLHEQRILRNSKFQNSLSYQPVCLAVIQILNFDEIFNMKQSVQSQYLQIYSSAMDICKQFGSMGGGMLESFDQERFIFTYRSDVSVVLPTIENVMKQLELKFKHWNQSVLDHPPRFGCGLMSGDVISGVIGSKTIKKKIIFGNILESGIQFAEKNKFWRSTRILCSGGIIKSLKQYGMKLVHRPIDDELYEIVERNEIESDEWMYELKQKRLKERFEGYKKGYKMMKKGDHAAAVAQFKKFLEESPDDFPGIHYHKYCLEQMEEET